MQLEDIARQIPAKYRTVILENNHIYKAVLKFDDWDMMQLWFYYSNFIEPDTEMYKYDIKGGRVVVEHQCAICLGTLKQRWEALLPALIKLEMEHNMLKNL